MQRTQETWVQSLGGKIPWRKAWQPTPIFLSGESHGQRSLAVDGSKGRQSRTQLSDLASTYTRTRAYYSHFFKDSFPI